MLTRLNKYIATSGYCSRRKADELIKANKVKINNILVNDLSTKVKEEDVVSIDDKVLEKNYKNIYIILHKPKGCITTLSDDKNRKTVFDYINIKERLFPIGRLDYDTEGLLILTNDGELSNVLTHPKNEVPKTYQVVIKGDINDYQLKSLREGVVIDNRPTKKAFVKVLKKSKEKTKIEITIKEGRNRQIRKMFESIDKEVILLKRVAIGNLKLGGLTRGTYRHLSKEEVNYLKSFEQLKEFSL